jgi:hypothetical protein
VSEFAVLRMLKERDGETSRVPFSGSLNGCPQRFDLGFVVGIAAIFASHRLRNAPIDE